MQFHLRTLKVCLVTRPKVLEENGILFRAWICGAGTEWGCDVNLGCAFINIMAVAMVMINVGRGGDVTSGCGGTSLAIHHHHYHHHTYTPP